MTVSYEYICRQNIWNRNAFCPAKHISHPAHRKNSKMCKLLTNATRLICSFINITHSISSRKWSTKNNNLFLYLSCLEFHWPQYIYPLLDYLFRDVWPTLRDTLLIHSLIFTWFRFTYANLQSIWDFLWYVYA